MPKKPSLSSCTCGLCFCIQLLHLTLSAVGGGFVFRFVDGILNDGLLNDGPRHRCRRRDYHSGVLELHDERLHVLALSLPSGDSVLGVRVEVLLLLIDKRLGLESIGLGLLELPDGVLVL